MHISDLSRNIARRLASFHSFALPLAKQPCLFTYIERWQAMTEHVLSASLALESARNPPQRPLRLPIPIPGRRNHDGTMESTPEPVSSPHYSGTNIAERVGRTAKHHPNHPPHPSINVTRPLDSDALAQIMDLVTPDFARREMLWLKAFLHNVPSPVVFCHNDLQVSWRDLLVCAF